MVVGWATPKRLIADGEISSANLGSCRKPSFRDRYRVRPPHAKTCHSSPTLGLFHTAAKTCKPSDRFLDPRTGAIDPEQPVGPRNSRAQSCRSRHSGITFGNRRPGSAREHTSAKHQPELLLRRMNLKAVSHGFPSTFRDWYPEQTDFTREVAEISFAHAIGNKVEAAYRSGDLLENRFGLLRDWAAFCFAENGTSSAAANRVPLAHLRPAP
jgi:hypothetical protein